LMLQRRNMIEKMFSKMVNVIKEKRDKWRSP